MVLISVYFFTVCGEYTVLENIVEDLVFDKIKHYILHRQCKHQGILNTFVQIPLVLKSHYDYNCSA